MISNIPRAAVVAYCVAWIVAGLAAMPGPEFCGGPNLTVLWVDGLHTIARLPGGDALASDSFPCRPSNPG